MKTIIHILCLLILLFVAFKAGSESYKRINGYRFVVHAEKKYPFALGEIKWQYVTESIGPAFLDPGTTIIEFAGRRLYCAKRIFQESVPFARITQVNEKQILWNDGEYSYHLTISPIERKEEPNKAAQTIEAGNGDG